MDITAAIAARMTNLVARRFPAVGKRATERQVEKYRSSGGRKGNAILGRPVFLLEVAGRKSGVIRSVMLMLVRRNDDLIVIGSAGGGPKTPDWYRNLIAAGGGTVQVGAERWSVTATESADGPERDECWKLATAVYSGFDSYQTFTDRKLPLAVLRRI